MLKRILAALLCAAVMAPLAACGGESDAPAPAANAETAAADEIRRQKPGGRNEILVHLVDIISK